jgi:hypothetical protein
MRIVRFLRDKWRALVKLLLAAILIGVLGCVPFPYRCYDGSFAGLGQRLGESSGKNAVLHVLMVHGMGDHCPGYGDLLAANLSRELGLALAEAPRLLSLTSSLGVTNWLREFRYQSGSKVIQFHELTWTPTTFPLKVRAFDYDRRLASERVLLNRSLKHDVMDEGLGDALLYLNPSFREKMQEPIRQAIDLVAQQTHTNDNIVLIASSLGSKMTFDTVDQLVTSSTNTNAVHFSERTTDIIMLANQISLLSLATDTDLFATVHPERSLPRFLEHSRKLKNARRQRMEQHAESFPTNEITINVVAATDPNDLLSYPVSTNNVPANDVTNQVRIVVSNIYKYNASAFLGVFEHPLWAHTHYDQNSWLVKRLVRGFSADKACLRTPVPEPEPCASTPANHL